MLTPDEAFAQLGNETRISILEALWERHEPYGLDTALSFSDLYDRVDASDTGNFNYHLDQLLGHFVRQTAEGYELAAPGVRIVNAITAGAPTTNPTIDEVPIDELCMRCGAAVHLTYDDGDTWIRCTDCDGFWPLGNGELLVFELPPRGFENRSATEALDATIKYTINRINSMLDGVCPDCGDTINVGLELCHDHDSADGRCQACSRASLGELWLFCHSCQNAHVTPSFLPVHRHPALVAFYHKHGIDHYHNSWADVRRGFEWDESLLGTDPDEYRVTVTHDGDKRAFRLDDSGSVVAVES